MARDPRKLAITISLAVSVVMLVGKLAAYFITHSAAMLADAAESIVHGAATTFAAFSLWYAAQPADADHPYGHGRIVYLSIGFEGALVLAASLAVICSGIDRLLRPGALTHLGTGLLISGSLAMINFILGLTLVSVGRRHNAVVLVANGRHVLSDFWTTAAAIAGVGAVLMTGKTWADPLAAILIGTWIMISGVALMRDSYRGLMDKLDSELAARLERGLQEAVAMGVIMDFHRLRCRQVNDEIYVDVHLLADGDLALADAHARATRVELELRARFPNHRVHFATHLEPDDHDAAHPDGEELEFRTPA